MKKRVIRSVFIFFLLFLPVQYGLIGVISLFHSEPWPAFIFPGFKNVFVFEEGTYAITVLEFHAWCEQTNETIVISPLELFDNIPRSQSQGFNRINFSEDSGVVEFSELTLQWLRGEAESRFPGHRFSHLDAVWIERYFNDTGKDARPDSVAEINRLTIVF